MRPKDGRGRTRLMESPREIQIQVKVEGGSVAVQVLRGLRLREAPIQAPIPVMCTQSQWRPRVLALTLRSHA